MKKIHLNLLVNEELVKKARDYGLNLSRFFENQLQGYFKFIEEKQNMYTPYISSQSTKIKDDKPVDLNGKSNNLKSHSYKTSWACGVAWYPCGFGSHRPAFKSQQAHFFTYPNIIPLQNLYRLLVW